MGEIERDTAISGVIVELALTGWDNAYTAPGKLGLEVLNEAEDTEASYSFDMFVVWRNLNTGQLYFGTDNGCSCPSPFEDYRKVSDLTAATVAEIHTALDGWAKDLDYSQGAQASAVELHGKLAAL